MLYIPSNIWRIINTKLFNRKFSGTDFSTYNKYQKEFLFQTIQVVQVLKNILETNLLDPQSGAIHPKVKLKFGLK